MIDFAERVNYPNGIKVSKDTEIQSVLKRIKALDVKELTEESQIALAPERALEWAQRVITLRDRLQLAMASENPQALKNLQIDPGDEVTAFFACQQFYNRYLTYHQKVYQSDRAFLESFFFKPAQSRDIEASILQMVQDPENGFLTSAELLLLIKKAKEHQSTPIQQILAGIRSLFEIET